MVGHLNEEGENMHARDELINRIINKYLGSITLARQAYMSDGQYYAEVAKLRHIMEIFFLAMEQDQIGLAQRISVLERVLMGAPDASEAMKRLEHMKRLREAIKVAPLSGDWKPLWREEREEGR
jgi:hypothetical protein